MTDIHTLVDVLSMVPDLLPCHLLNLWPSRNAGIRVLRLVSKEVGSIALRSVKSCAFTLGQWQKPDPKKVVSLIAGAQLDSLQLRIATFPGKNHWMPV